jgi:hypothetical protein
MWGERSSAALFRLHFGASAPSPKPTRIEVVTLAHRALCAMFNDACCKQLGAIATIVSQ